MADDATATETTEPTQDSITEPQDQLGDAGKKALDAERRNARSAAKERDALAARLKEYEDRDKTEAERSQERVSKAETERDDAKAEALRLRVAVQHGISIEDADLFLTGKDEQTLTAQAKRLTDRDADRKKQGNHVPREGQTPTSPKNDPLREFARSVFGGGG